MDSRLKLILNGDPEEVLMLMIRLKTPDVVIPFCTVITQFGDIITCRLKRKHLLEVYNSPDTFSVKAARLIPATRYTADNEDSPGEISNPSRRFNTPYTGKGIYSAFVDWGFDIAHVNLCNPDGSTRFKCIWDQNAAYDGNKYGYGCVYSRDDINKALQTAEPYTTLGYHPGRQDAFDSGMHGTHVVDIAAGRPVIGEGGVSTESILIGVQLGNNFVNGSDLALGDSVRLNEALDFIHINTTDAPCVINMSLGSHGDSHTGKSLVELSFDNFLLQYAGYAIVQSVGNYYSAHCHLQHTIKQDEIYNIEWIIPHRHFTPNEVEIWYPGSDQFSVRLIAPDGEVVADTKPFDDIQISYRNQAVGYIFHRSHEPNTGLNHIDIILDISMLDGTWLIELAGTVVSSGSFHAYCERNDVSQARFSPHQSSPYTTTGSVCNGKHSITAGAYDHRDLHKPVVSFSSAGPTVDGKVKPDLLAPGFKIEAAKSAPSSSPLPVNELTVKSGSSMAAPHVAGTLALLFQKHLPQRLTIEKTKQLLLQLLDPLPDPLSADDRIRAGNGLLNIAKLVNTKDIAMQTPYRTRPARRPQNDTEYDEDQEYHAPYMHDDCLQCEEALIESIEQGNWENESDLLNIIRSSDYVDTISSFDVYRHFHPKYSFNYSPYSDLFVPIGLPNKYLPGDLKTGDILITRSVLGNKNENSIVVSARKLDDDELNHTPAARRQGYYIQAYGTAGKTNQTKQVRIADANGIIPGNVLILRSNRLTEEDTSQEDTGDIKEFPLNYINEGKRKGYGFNGDKSINYTAVFKANNLNDLETKAARHFMETEGGIDSINAYDDQIITWGFGFSGAAGNFQIALFDLFSSSSNAKDDFASYGITLSSASKNSLSITADSKTYTGIDALNFWRESKLYINILISLTQKYAAEAFAAQWRTFKKLRRPVFAAFQNSSYLAGVSNEIEKNKAKVAILHAHHHLPGLNPPGAFTNATSLDEVLKIYYDRSHQIKGVDKKVGIWRESINRFFGKSSPAAPAPLPPEQSKDIQGYYGPPLESLIDDEAEEDAPEKTEWSSHPNIRRKYRKWQLYKTVRDTVTDWGISNPADYIEVALIEWNAKPGIHIHFPKETGFDGNPHSSYLNLKRLYNAKGIPDLAAYISINIVSVTFFNRTFPAHRDLAIALKTVQKELEASGNKFNLDKGTWSFVPRTFNDDINTLSNHALGKAVDVNPDSNPMITSVDILEVIEAVCGQALPKGLVNETDPDVLRNASVVFQQTFNDNWIKQQTSPALLQSISKRRTSLDNLARIGFLNLPSLLIISLVNAGMDWGGAWKTKKDFMHFELPDQ